MLVIIILCFLVVGIVELSLWSERNWQDVVAYVVLLVAAAILSVLIFLNANLPVPEPLEVIFRWLEKLWSGGLS